MKRPHSVRARLTLRWTLSFGLLLAAVLAVIHALWGAMAREDLDARLRTLAATDAVAATDAPEGLHLHPLPSTGHGEAAGTFGQVLSREGSVAASLGLEPDSPPLFAGEELARALREEVPIRSVRVAGRPARLAVVRVAKDGLPWLVAVGLWTDDLESSLRRLALLLAGSWAACLALTAALGWSLASSALAPVERITARAAFIARGNFAARLDPPAVDDELGRMTCLLNEMLERLGGALEASRRFASDASHELRGPLTAMLGEIDVTLKRERDAPEYRSVLETVRRQAAALVELTSNLMLLARAQEGLADGLVMEVPLGPAASETLGRLSALAGTRGVRVKVEPFGPLLVYAEPGLLARALDNLVRNAIQYNAEGGVVLVTAEADRPATEPRAEEPWETATVTLRVSDTGPGVPEAERDRIFERFHRVDPSRSRRTGGTGLGLSIAREVAQLFGGTLVLERTSTAGSVFALRLPGREADEKDELLPSSPSSRAVPAF